MSTFYVSDLDGTLLDPQACLSDFALSNLEELLNEGLAFTVASARSVFSIQQILRGLKLRLPVVEFNGAYISDLETGRHEIVNAFDPSLAEELCALMDARRCAPFISSFNGRDDLLHYSRIDNDGMQWYVDDRVQMNDYRLRHTPDVRQCLKEQIVCLTVIGPFEPVCELEQVVRERFGAQVETVRYENRYQRGWEWLSVHDRRSTKDQGIRTLMERYSMDAHELVVFGDDVNDIPMFRSADRAVAVEGAVEELRQLASETIGSNAEDAVVRYLLKRARR